MAGKQSNKRTGLVSLFFLLALILTANRCEEKPFASQLITFIIPVDIQPSDSVLAKGDTLWLTVTVSDSLYEYHTQKKYKLSNFDFGQTSIGVRRLVDKSKDLSDQVSAVSDFNVITTTGDITFLGNTFIDIKFRYDSQTSKYLLKFGFIAKSVGVYCFAMLSPKSLDYRGVIDLGKSNEGATILPVYEDFFFPVNNGVNNFELFKEYVFDTSVVNPGNYQEFNYIRKGTFTFRVVE